MRRPDEEVKGIPVPLHSTLGPRVHMAESILVGWPPSLWNGLWEELTSRGRAGGGQIHRFGSSFPEAGRNVDSVSRSLAAPLSVTGPFLLSRVLTQLMAVSALPVGLPQGGGGGPAPAWAPQAANRKQENKTTPWLTGPHHPGPHPHPSSSVLPSLHPAHPLPRVGFPSGSGTSHRSPSWGVRTGALPYSQTAQPCGSPS